MNSFLTSAVKNKNGFENENWETYLARFALTGWAVTRAGRVAGCEAGKLFMKTEAMNLGRETEFQLRLREVLGDKNIVA